MSLRAQYLKAGGVVIDGHLRDLQEHRDISFPVSHTVSLKIPLTTNYCVAILISGLWNASYVYVNMSHDD